MSNKQQNTAGLADVVACNSTITYIDGENGKLLYRGLEQLRSNRLIRPTAQYTGPELKKYVDIVCRT